LTDKQAKDVFKKFGDKVENFSICINDGYRPLTIQDLQGLISINLEEGQ
jgi:hypothetical protein